VTRCLCGLLMCCQASLAGQLEVTSDAATIGNQGLRVTAGIICTTDNIALTGPTVTTDQLACDEISTSGNVQVTNDVSFTAGDGIVLGPGFGVDLGVRFAASVNPFVDSPYAFVEDTSPTAETSYNARFDLNVDGLNLSSGEDIHHFVALSDDDTVQFRLIMRHVGDIQLVLVARSGGSLIEHSTAIPLQAGFNDMFLQWTSGTGNGSFQVTVNNDAVEGPVNLNNASSRIDKIRWGLVDGPAVITTTGSIDQDDFMSFR